MGGDNIKIITHRKPSPIGGNIKIVTKTHYQKVKSDWGEYQDYYKNTHKAKPDRGNIKIITKNTDHEAKPGRGKIKLTTKP
jgi:hypothetical protein